MIHVLSLMHATKIKIEQPGQVCSFSPRPLFRYYVRFPPVRKKVTYFNTCRRNIREKLNCSVSWDRLDMHPSLMAII